MPFLPVREDFHPKRNQARQKLATLPRNRFKDLASDVFFELRRRYPEFEEEMEAEEEEVSSRLVSNCGIGLKLTTYRTGRDYTMNHLPHLDLDTRSQRQDTPTTPLNPHSNSLIDNESLRLLHP